VAGPRFTRPLLKALYLMNPNIKCPNCQASFKLKEARTEILDEQESTPMKTVNWVYTFCPVCRKDFGVKGEKKAAGVILASFFALMTSTLVTGSLYPFVAAAVILLFQNRISKYFIKIEKV
jgi:hypothetical protein